MRSENMNTLWFLQRLSAIFLLACLPAVFSAILQWSGMSGKEIITWLSWGRVLTFGLFFTCVFFHSYLGIEIVIEDYLRPYTWRDRILFLSKYLHIFFVALSWLTLMVLGLRS